MKKIFIFLAVLTITGCTRKPVNTYILSFEKDGRQSLEFIPLILRSDGDIILAENDSIAYKIGLGKFYKQRYEEEKLGGKAITTGFVISSPDIKGHEFRYSLTKQHIDKSKENTTRQRSSLKRFISE